MVIDYYGAKLFAVQDVVRLSHCQNHVASVRCDQVQLEYLNPLMLKVSYDLKSGNKSNLAQICSRLTAPSVHVRI